MLKFAKGALTQSCLESLLTEARRNGDFMTKEEESLKRKLIKLLKDDGHGHHHALYAQRLLPFNVKIVPVNSSPETAAISFDEGVIFVNRGFLRDPKTFYQLPVILRHELCHNLLMHQLRMLKHLSQIPESHLRMSSSLHTMFNIIEDFEISNKKYTDYDKEVLRNLWLNGKLISALVTEDHRASWIKMSVEDMYDAVVRELAAAGWTGELSGNKDEPSDTLAINAAKLLKYKDIQRPTDFESVDEFIDALLEGPRELDPDFELDPQWQAVIDGIKWVEEDPNTVYTPQDVVAMMKQIQNTRPDEPVDVISPESGEVLATLYIPEEKNIAMEMLKIIAGHTNYQAEYQAWYNEMLKTVANDPDLTDEDIQDLLDCVS